jgi:2'-5' RNA ligase
MGTGTSTVQLDVPAAWPLQEAVADLDRVTLLSPPHVTLAWRWLPAAAARGAADALAEVVAAAPPFDLSLPRVASFPADPRVGGERRDPRGRVVVHAVVEPPGPLTALAGAIRAIAGDAPELTPHLSVARVRRGGPLREVRRRAAALLPLTTRATSVHLHVQEGAGWRVVGVYPLGG